MRTKNRYYPSEQQPFYIPFSFRGARMNPPYLIDSWPIPESGKQLKTSSFTFNHLPKSPLWSFRHIFPLPPGRNEFSWHTKIMACFILIKGVCTLEARVWPRWGLNEIIPTHVNSQRFVYSLLILWAQPSRRLELSRCWRDRAAETGKARTAVGLSALWVHED